MYLSEEKRAAIRKYFGNQNSNSNIEFEQNKSNFIKGFYETECVREVNQILFNVRYGKAVFTIY